MTLSLPCVSLDQVCLDLLEDHAFFISFKHLQTLVMASPASPPNSPSTSSDIPVTFEDQQKINRFARLNARMEEIKDELKGKKVVIQNMDDALSDITAAELEADDDSEGVRIMEGEVFVAFDFSNATEWIEAKKKKVESEAETLNSSIETIKEEMNELKTALYARFGKDNINLESDE